MSPPTHSGKPSLGTLAGYYRHRVLRFARDKASYRILPDDELDPVVHIGNSALAVFLLGNVYEEAAHRLTQTAANIGKPWFVWAAPELEHTGSLNQRGFYRHLLRL